MKKRVKKEMSATFHRINKGILKFQQMYGNEELFSEIKRLIQII